MPDAESKPANLTPRDALRRDVLAALGRDPETCSGNVVEFVSALVADADKATANYEAALRTVASLRRVSAGLSVEMDRLQSWHDTAMDTLASVLGEPVRDLDDPVGVAANAIRTLREDWRAEQERAAAFRDSRESICAAHNTLRAAIAHVCGYVNTVDIITDEQLAANVRALAVDRREAQGCAVLMERERDAAREEGRRAGIAEVMEPGELNSIHKLRAEVNRLRCGLASALGALDWTVYTDAELLDALRTRLAPVACTPSARDRLVYLALLDALDERVVDDAVAAPIVRALRAMGAP